MLGNLKYSLANSSLGAIITHCVISDDGEHLAAAESGEDNTDDNDNVDKLNSYRRAFV